MKLIIAGGKDGLEGREIREKHYKLKTCLKRDIKV